MAFNASEKIRAATLNSYIASGDYSTYAEYGMNGPQTVADSSSVVVFFGYQNRASPLVSQSLDQLGHRFTLNRAGLWAITASLRWGSNVAGGERYSAIGGSTNGVASQSDGYLNGTGPPVNNLSATRYFAVGAYVRIEVWQSSGGPRDLEANNDVGWGRINLAWLHA